MIETRRLQLRKMIIEDTDALLTVFGDPKVMDSFGAAPLTREQMAAWVGRNLKHQEEHGYGLFSVILKSEDELVGDCGLEHMDVDGEHLVELGYDFSSRHWGQGLATEAACAVRDFAFGTLGLERLVSLIRASNGASQRVSEKVGMHLCRKLSRHGHEYLLYSIDRETGQAADNGRSSFAS
jgi:ribosomal-protein-alanine N-acetyltransferase